MRGERTLTSAITHMHNGEVRRTTIMLPDDLRKEAMRVARRRGTSLGALIRDLLLAEVEGRRTGFLDRDVVFREEPPDGAPKHHDDIYG